MKILLTTCSVIFFLVVLLIFLLSANARLASRRARKRLALRLQPVTAALAAKAEPPRSAIAELAADPQTRAALHRELAKYERLDLFPAAYITWPLMGETELVAWLCHPNELNGPPDEIEFMGEFAVPDDDTARFRYLLFRFRTHPPHWNADRGWLAGVAGPYEIAQRPAPNSTTTFSRFEAFDAHPAEQHVRRTHDLLVNRAGGLTVGQV